MEEIKDIKISGNSQIRELMEKFENTGFQASHLAKAVRVFKKMKEENCTVYLSFTANMIASGLRGLIMELCKKKLVDIIVTTSGAIDHDIIKSFKPYLMGSFTVDDEELHKKQINRIGNIFIPSDRYILLEEKIIPIFQEMYNKEKIISPSELNQKIGSTLNESSFLYWCNKNNIPVFCPGITDGAIGLQMYFFKQENKDFVVDVTKDMKELADITLNAEKTGALILGGGISKHHIIGANLIRDGLEYAVYLTTALEYDGSLSGAQTKEAKSWGKLKEEAKAVTVIGDTTILLPLFMESIL